MALAVVQVQVGIYVHVHVERKRMTHLSNIAPRLVIRVVTGNDVRVVTVVVIGGIVFFTRDPK